jgi:hypothetical protein
MKPGARSSLVAPSRREAARPMTSRARAQGRVVLIRRLATLWESSAGGRPQTFSA